MSSVIRIGTRESKLAMWQAEHVHALLQSTYPEITFEIKGMTTLGDVDQLKPLSQFGTKSIFTKELDTALITGAVDIVVHCMKDLATVLPEGIEFCAVMERGKVADSVLINPKHIELAKSVCGSENNCAGPSKLLSALPDGAVIGTSALRRQATLSRLHPQLTYKDIRGNVGTRIGKLDSGDYDAIILANIGLDRLGLADRVACKLDVETYQYAVGQGALAIVCREGDEATKKIIHDALHDNTTAWECYAERGLLAGLQGGCKVPIAIDSKNRSVSAKDAEKYISDLNTFVEEQISSSSDESSVIIPGEDLSSVPELSASSQDAVILFKIRASVMSLDGAKMLQCPIAFAVSADQGAKNETLAWDAGVALSKLLLRLGASAILDEIRS